jgi:hypothetical protein
MSYDNYTSSGVDKDKGMRIIQWLVFVVLFEFIFGFSNTIDYLYDKFKSNNYTINIGFNKSSDNDSNKVVNINIFNKNLFEERQLVDNGKEFELKYIGEKGKLIKKEEIDSDYEYYVRNERMGRNINIDNDKSSVYNSLTTRIVHKNNPTKKVELRNPDEAIEKVLPNSPYRHIEKKAYYKQYKDLALEKAIKENNGETDIEDEGSRELIVINH